MAIRGIDTQMLATKPADLAGSQARLNKESELHMQQGATLMTKTAETQKDRAAAATQAEGKQIGTEEREKGNGQSGSGQKEEQKQETKTFQDPMLSLPIEKGKYAKKQHHFIDVQL